ncbi:MAG: hypothetical protein PVF91_00320 [Chromatiales bacterium]|jgi:hypothetical protein
MTSDTRAARKHLRFKPDPLEYAQVSLGPGADTFEPDFVALIVDESPVSGCSLIAHQRDDLNLGDVCRVKIGRLAPVQAEVSWMRPEETGLMRIGFAFLE